MPLIHFLFRFPSRLRRKARRSRLTLMLLVLFLAICLITPLYVVYKPPGFMIDYLQRRNPSVLFHIPASSLLLTTPSTTTDDEASTKKSKKQIRKIIALTIDDAPSPYTDEIRAVLKENQVHATFFVIGNQISSSTGEEDSQKKLIDLVNDGHELGNHAMYDEPALSLTNEVLTDQINQVHSLLLKVYQLSSSSSSSAFTSPSSSLSPEEIQQRQHQEQPPKYYRPGSGFFSRRILDLVQDQLGYKLVLGSIYPHDAQVSSWRMNAAHILSMVRPGGIVICHDRRAWTVPMLKKVLPEIKRRGYEIVTVSELLSVAAGAGSVSGGDNDDNHDNHDNHEARKATTRTGGLTEDEGKEGRETKDIQQVVTGRSPSESRSKLASTFAI